MSQNGNQPGFWPRLGRALSWSLLTLLKLVFVIAVVTLVVAGGWYVAQTAGAEYTGLQQRLAVLEFAAGTNDERDMANQTRIAELEEEVDRLQRELDDDRVDLAADLAEQDAALAALQLQLSDNISRTNAIDENLALVGTAIVSLQADLNANALQIDALGGISDTVTVDIVNLQADLAALDESLTALDESLPDVEQTQNALALFRLWQFLARARLQLLENNVGLAAADISRAEAAVADLLAAAPDEAAGAALTNIATRLSLAQAQLPADPAGAARDLDAAWEAVDGLLTTLLGGEAAQTLPEEGG